MSKAASNIRFQIRETPTSELIRGTFKSTKILSLTVITSDDMDVIILVLMILNDMIMLMTGRVYNVRIAQCTMRTLSS